MAIGEVVPKALLMRLPGPAGRETSRLAQPPMVVRASGPVDTLTGSNAASRSCTVYGASPRATRIAHHGTVAADRDQEVTLSGAKIPF